MIEFLFLNDKLDRKVTCCSDVANLLGNSEMWWKFIFFYCFIFPNILDIDVGIKPENSHGQLFGWLMLVVILDNDWEIRGWLWLTQGHKTMTWHAAFNESKDKESIELNIWIYWNLNFCPANSFCSYQFMP